MWRPWRCSQQSSKQPRWGFQTSSSHPVLVFKRQRQFLWRWGERELEVYHHSYIWAFPYGSDSRTTWRKQCRQRQRGGPRVDYISFKSSGKESHVMLVLSQTKYLSFLGGEEDFLLWFTESRIPHYMVVVCTWQTCLWYPSLLQICKTLLYWSQMKQVHNTSMLCISSFIPRLKWTTPLCKPLLSANSCQAFSSATRCFWVALELKLSVDLKPCSCP